jgi:hypothetical protein
MATTISDTIPATAELARCEEVVRELLMLADQQVHHELSPAAARAVALASSMSGIRTSRWPAIYRHAARCMREHCISLGASRSRYVAGEWVRLGL